ncbi:IDEAL domain-containing protein [Paenibacillus validus]|uniref:IDEAL domain-containing protein n=1 Tax=Paenibacillus validus TaxID=44253 RepID=A0A7X2ZB81_9BACL|nr:MULTISPECIES: IDEAL domain-containing protein [Paenibacillus]MED4603284.1 IDEAL domain-containing protein [Paenibacillus validus]MED4605507.1 IDEAL domain-containing protein [Paenibacillus validus]MUG71744.1 IDEAL domain-containing protein [Paenibacillus validus]
MGKMNVTNDMMLSLFAEMMLDEAIRDYREKKLYNEIDQALAAGDEQSFIALTTELNTLRSQGI